MDPNQLAQVNQSIMQGSQNQQPQQRFGGFLGGLINSLPAIGGTVGAIAGTPFDLLSGPAGTIAGGAGGAGIGDALKQLLQGQNFNLGEVGSQTALGGLGGAAGEAIGPVLGLVGKGLGKLPFVGSVPEAATDFVGNMGAKGAATIAGSTPAEVINADLPQWGSVLSKEMSGIKYPTNPDEMAALLGKKVVQQQAAKEGLLTSSGVQPVTTADVESALKSSYPTLVNPEASVSESTNAINPAYSRLIGEMSDITPKSYLGPGQGVSITPQGVQRLITVVDDMRANPQSYGIQLTKDMETFLNGARQQLSTLANQAVGGDQLAQTNNAIRALQQAKGNVESGVPNYSGVATAQNIGNNPIIQRLMGATGLLKGLPNSLLLSASSENPNSNPLSPLPAQAATDTTTMGQGNEGTTLPGQPSDELRQQVAQAMLDHPARASQIAAAFQMAYPYANNKIAAQTQTALLNLNNAATRVGQLQQLYNQVPHGVMGGVLGELGVLGKGNIPGTGIAAAYEQSRRGEAMALAKAMSGIGARVSNLEIQQILNLIPSAGDSPQTANLKWNELNNQIQASAQALSAFPTGGTNASDVLGSLGGGASTSGQ